MTCFRFETGTSPCRCPSTVSCACCGVDLHHEHHRATGTCESATCEYYLLGVKAERARSGVDAAIAAAVRAERERIAGLVDALAQKAADEELRYSRQSFGDCGRHHGVGSDALEELVASLRGAP